MNQGDAKSFRPDGLPHSPAYGDGWQAFDQCIAREDCPDYEFFLDQWDWLDGWDAAKRFAAEKYNET